MAWKVLRLGTFRDLGCFEAWNVLRLETFLGLGCFEAWNALCLGRLIVGNFFVFRAWVCSLAFWSWDVLQLGPYVMGRFVFGMFLGWDVL